MPPREHNLPRQPWSTDVYPTDSGAALTTTGQQSDDVRKVELGDQSGEEALPPGAQSKRDCALWPNTTTTDQQPQRPLHGFVSAPSGCYERSTMRPPSSEVNADARTKLATVDELPKEEAEARSAPKVKLTPRSQVSTSKRVLDPESKLESGDGTIAPNKSAKITEKTGTCAKRESDGAKSSSGPETIRGSVTASMTSNLTKDGSSASASSSGGAMQGHY